MDLITTSIHYLLRVHRAQNEMLSTVFFIFLFYFHFFAVWHRWLFSRSNTFWPTSPSLSIFATASVRDAIPDVFSLFRIRCLHVSFDRPLPLAPPDAHHKLMWTPLSSHCISPEAPSSFFGHLGYIFLLWISQNLFISDVILSPNLKNPLKASLLEGSQSPFR